MAEHSEDNRTDVTNILIREMVLDDWDRGLSECLGLFGEATAPKNLTSIWAERHEVGIYTLVAVDTETLEVVGTLSLHQDLKLIHGGCISGRIEDVAVREDYQGQGIAGYLIKTAVATAKKLGHYKVTLTCRDELVPLYEQSGFHKHENEMRADL